MTFSSPAPQAGRSAPLPDTAVHGKDARDRLFPLAFTPWEQLFLLDDLPAYPMHFFVRLRFVGRLQARPLDEALALARERHPLLTAIAHESQGKLQWRPCQDAPPAVQWLEQEPGPALPTASHFDLHQQPGLYVFAVVGASTSDLVLQFHHAACDGIGALDFANDVLTAYANALSGTNKYSFKPLDPVRLRERGRLPLTGRRLVVWVARRLVHVKTLWRFFRRRPVPVLPHTTYHDDPTPGRRYPEACFHHFTAAESAVLAKAARGSEASLNSLLARDLLLAVAAWREKNHLSNDVWLRVMVPISLRSPADRRLPAANVISAVYLDRHLTEVRDPEALLAGIGALMEDAKSQHLGLAWLLALPLLQLMADNWRNALRSRRRPLFSALLTNMGPLFAASPLPRAERRLVVGDLVVENVEIVPAARPLQCLGFAISNYAGRMSIGLRYQSQALTQEQAQDVLEVYVGALRKSMGQLQRALPTSLAA